MKAFNEGYKGDSLYSNPYWINYPKKDCPEQEQLDACNWVMGYAQKIIDSHSPNGTERPHLMKLK